MAAAITTPNCTLYAASLARPVSGWSVLSVTFDECGAASMHRMLHNAMASEFGAVGRKTALPLTDLEDGSYLLRFVPRQTPPLVNREGRRIIVEPPIGSVLRIDAEIRPMRSHVGIIPIMQRVIVLQFVSAAVTSNRGVLG
jgi:hypothetical protein